MTREMNWFCETLLLEFGLLVDSKEISTEGYELYHEEVDEALIKADILTDLPNPLLYETLAFESEENEWLGMIGMHPISRNWLLQVILLNGKQVFTNKIQEEN